MDSATLSSRMFVTENVSSGEQASMSSNYLVSRTDSGYILDISLTGAEATLSNAEDDVMVQLSFESVSQDLIMYQNATYMGLNSDSEPWYRFEFHTTYDIDSSNMINFTNFSGLTSALDARSDLSQKFNIIIAMKNVTPPAGYIDNIGAVFTQSTIGQYDMPITHEIIEISFGTHMDSLWRRSRSVYKNKVYKKYTTSLQKVYEKMY